MRLRLGRDGVRHGLHEQGAGKETPPPRRGGAADVTWFVSRVGLGTPATLLCL
jgi:hypothetical protein